MKGGSYKNSLCWEFNLCSRHFQMDTDIVTIVRQPLCTAVNGLDPVSRYLDHGMEGAIKELDR